MITVCRGYLTQGRRAERVLVDSANHIYRNAREGWISVPDGVVIRVGKPYAKPLDVPVSWIGACPWWQR